MGHHHHDHHHHYHNVDGPYNDPLMACCCCPCFLISNIFSMIGRCFFVACYPFIRCFGLDEHRHHHHHSHFN
ncbi:hypothetical protein QJS04_geneDACA005823 [Acorus gramineus]|uniref:Uncharacterized protein n=1 Tax=Acorus gramineus TaxID=55184 RepID=A0AAV9B3V7_ACOGR|nr:hypothetical protein QJS04_geneDACA005823 [Acorus gramineus]